jgi:hypothetical protein
MDKVVALLIARRLNKKSKRAMACTCRFWRNIIGLSNEYKRHHVSDRCALIYKAGSFVIHCRNCLQFCEIQGHTPASIHQLVTCCRCKQVYCKHFKHCLQCDCELCRHRKEYCVCWRDRCSVCKQKKDKFLRHCSCAFRDRFLSETGGQAASWRQMHDLDVKEMNLFAGQRFW